MITAALDEVKPMLYIRCSQDENALFKSCGFTFDHNRFAWMTNHAHVAKQAAPLLPKSLRKKIQGWLTRESREVVRSRAQDSTFTAPAPEGLSYLPYQLAGIEWMHHRDATLLGDQMGLGKSVQVVGLMNLEDPSSTLVICPASLKINWEREINRWTTRHPVTHVVSGNCWKNHSDVVIINYDILKRHREAIRDREWDLLVVDECHYMQNRTAQRTKEIMGSRGNSGIEAGKKVFLTGTPIVNRPIELWPVLRTLDPYGWPGYWEYAKRYCDAQPVRRGRKSFWDVKGSSNLDELQARLRASCMIRRLKEDVLTELPPKQRQVVEMTDSASKKVLQKAQRLIMEKLFGEVPEVLTDAQYRRLIKAMADPGTPDFTELSRIRRETGDAKVPLVVEHLREAIDSSGKVVCFCHHKGVVASLAEEFGDACVTVTGDTALMRRQENVDRFQADGDCRLFIGNIQAAGVGLTLTAASHVVFAELDWVPGNVTQAEDRCHRIGQDESVLVQHLVLEGSLDAVMAKTIVAKQEILDKALDEDGLPEWIREVLS